jgi:peptidoglycan hydrolase-like protein with peptidoglycan-binding domain/tellurite resistance protein
MAGICWSRFRALGFAVLFFAAHLAAPLSAQTPDVNPRIAQQQLKDRGFDIGMVDGVWGPRSVRTLQDFQRSVGLPASGRLDATTMERLAREPFRIPAPGPVRSEPLPPPARPPEVQRPVQASPPAIIQPPIALPDPPQPVLQPQPPVAERVTQPSLHIPTYPTSSRSTSDGVGLIGKLIVGIVLLLALRGAFGWLRRNAAESKAAAAKATTGERTADIASIRRNPGQTSATSNNNLWRRGSNSGEFANRLAAYDSAVSEVLGHHPAQSGQGAITISIQVDPLRDPLAPVRSRSGFFRTSDDARPVQADWKAPGAVVEVAGVRITGGLIYVGTSLPRRDRYGQENCLINPNLPVARSADTDGQHLSYWPSYEELKPSSRRASLEWLASPRTDPATPIGYVFLYFYGLERRLMLETIATDESAGLIAEVRRLLAIYGDNHSFNRYANALLSAHGLRSGATVSEGDLQGRGFEVPIGLLVALGLRAKEKRVIEPDLLLAFARAHPETRVRTPAERARAEHRELFVKAVEAAFPEGVILKGWGKLPKLKATYRAASGSFEIDLLPPKHGLPDLTNMFEPMPTIRRLFEECSDQLDRYSRELGRSKGMTPTLATVARLPVALREAAAARLAGRPIEKVAEWAASGSAVDAPTLAAALGVDLPAVTDKSVLRELANILAPLGFGLTDDPQFALRKPRTGTPISIFALDAMRDVLDAPGESFRFAQVTLALGLIAAAVDGALSPQETALLARQVAATPSLSDNEKRRLFAELRAHAADPLTLSDIKTRLKKAPPDVRERLAENVISLAAADGAVDAREVTFIEKLFRQIDLDVSDVYNRLHAKLADTADRDGHSVAGLSATAGGAKSNTVDLARLAAIRAETAGTTAVLSTIFAEDDEPEAPASSNSELAASDIEHDGLDRRHHALVLELCDRGEWSRVEFEQVVRSAGLMPGAALSVINEWALDRFDELLIEVNESIMIHRDLLPADFLRENA